MTNQFKDIVKKLYKTGLFHSIEVKQGYIGFKNVHNVLFTFQLEVGKIGYFTAGYVSQWVERGLTFESEYTTIGDIELAKYNLIYIERTDNPDFILRQSKHITIN